MAEPQPAAIHEGASTPPAPPAASAAASATAAEQAALSSLDNKTLSGGDSSSAPKKEVDLKALNDAMKALDTTTTAGSSSDKKAAAAGTLGGAGKKDANAEPVKLVKVDGAHVGLVAEQLDMSRPRATELLRAHDADPVKAMKAWVTASV